MSEANWFPGAGPELSGEPHLVKKPNELDLYRENQRLAAEVAELQSRIVARFDGDHPPTFRQGVPTHELEDYLTAQDVTNMVKMIVDLEGQLAQVKPGDNCPRKYVQIDGKGPTYCLHGTSSIDAFEALLAKYLQLQCDIGALIPPLDGERANDPIIERVKRVVADNQRLRAEQHQMGVDLLEIERLHDRQKARLYNGNAELKDQVKALQAKIDALMLEYCPSEMTADQIERWAKHQKAVDE